MSKNKGTVTRDNVHRLLQRSKHRYNKSYLILLHRMSNLQKAKLSAICKKLDVAPYELRECEFQMVTNSRQNKKLFRRIKKHREVFDSCSMVLSQSMR